MTIHPPVTRTTTAAEGLPRWRFTVDEIFRMTELGIFDEHEHIELIGGEIVPMQAKGGPHERLKTSLNLQWAKRLPDDLLYTTETTFRLSIDTFLEPDFVFYPKAGGWDGLAADTALPVVELADSSLRWDLGRKADLYAGFGIVELWVIDAVRLVTHVHRAPGPHEYGSVLEVPPDAPLVPAEVPALAVTLADIELP